MRRVISIGMFSILLAALATACSADVAESDEYLAIESELAVASQAKQDALDATDRAQAELLAMQSELEEAEAAIEDARDETVEAQLGAAAAMQQAQKAESELQDALDIPWPDALRADFIDGCTEDGTLESGDAVVCSCMIDELEASVSLVDFFLLSYATMSPGEKLNSFGLPADMDPQLATAIASASTTCIVRALTSETTSVFELRVGDCFNDPTNRDVIDTVIVMPCSEPHDNEAYAILEVPGNDWPGEVTIGDWSYNHCFDLFEPYVDAIWEGSVLDLWYIYPLEESWTKYKDRTVTCVLYDADFDKLTDSMQGAGV